MEASSTKLKKVLIVDDNEEIRHALKEALEDNDFEVSTLKSGLELLGTLRTNNVPDVLILDIVMPGRTGIDVLTTVRSVWPIVKIIIHSGHGEYRSSIPSQFIDMFLEKPLPVEDIVKKVKALV